MSKIHITTLPEGKLGIIRMRDCNAADEPVILAKTLFELSRDPDNMSQHFDPVIHTLGAISGGLTGHCVITCRECDDTELPPETTFRNAWEDTGGAVRVNMTIARRLHMDTIREARNAELARQDLTFMRAVERGDRLAQSAIAKEKQRLRDIPQRFDLSGASTPADLLSTWPDNLSV